MKLNLNHLKLRISKNENNRFWNPIDQFHNVSEIMIDSEWYKCALNFVKKNDKYFIQFIHPMKVDSRTLNITEVYCKGIYIEVKTSKFKFNLIKFLLNVHPLNDFSYRVRSSVIERKRTFFIFSLALIPSILFYFINVNYNNLLIRLITDNLWIQTLFFFLTISGFISIFHPFTIRKELGKLDIEVIVEESLKREKDIEKIRKDAWFGTSR